MNLRQCGTVTQMNAAPMTLTDLGNYQKSGDWLIMGSLFHADFEIKICEAVQNGLYDFLMAQKVNLSKSIRRQPLTMQREEIIPFVMAKQYSPINNAYWKGTSGTATSTSASDLDCDWMINVESTQGIPLDIAYFPAGMVIFLEGKTAGGSATRTQWRVVESVAAAAYITLYLENMNAGSNLLPYMGDKLGAPSTAIVRRGVPNVNRYEKYCAEAPTLLTNKLVPFFHQGTRYTVCKSELYDKWKATVSGSNDYYDEFFNLDETEKNRQIGADWQRRLVDQMFWGKASSAKQNMYEYNELPEITAFDNSTYGLGVDGGAVVGRKADMVGVYEQLAECDRIVDGQGDKLDLLALFEALYRMQQVKKGNGSQKPDVFDLFTNSRYAEKINQAFLLYFKGKGEGMLSIQISGEGPPKTAAFGFNYRSYNPFWPAITVNVITHQMFDDWRDAGIAVHGADDTTTNVVWILDFAGIYPGILSSRRKVLKTGDHTTLAAVNAEFGCVEDVLTREVTMVGFSLTMIVECPASNLILENLSTDVPEWETQGVDYPTTNTTSTSVTPFDNLD